MGQTKDMTRYFYDNETSRMLAFDDGAKHIRVLEEIMRADSEEPAEPVIERVERSPEPRTYPPASPSARQWAGQAPRKGPGCDECGSMGRRHKKGCALAGTSKVEREEPTRDFAALSDKRPSLSQMQFGRVKISQAHDIPEQTIADNLEVPLEEIEKAFKVETYSEFLAA